MTDMISELTSEQKAIINQMAEGCLFDYWRDDLIVELSGIWNEPSVRDDDDDDFKLIVARGYWFDDFDNDNPGEQFLITRYAILPTGRGGDAFSVIEVAEAYINTLAHPADQRPHLPPHDVG